MKRVLMLALLVGGCSAGPDFKVPGFDLGSRWMHAGENEKNQVVLKDGWWKDLGDPILDGLVEKALRDGTTLKMAEARVMQARAQRAAANAAFLPDVSAGAGAVYSERSQNVASATPGARQGKVFDAGFDAAWELDIFGGVRRGAEAARADVGAASAQMADARLTMVADVVATYIDYRLAEQRLDLAATNVAAQERTLRLTEARYRAGDINGLGVAQAKAQMAATRALLPSIRQQKEVARGMLAVLVDELPTTFVVSESGALTAAPLPEVPAGVPSTVLARRPDVAAAEQRLHASTARIGEAKALRLPVFSLTASTGVQSTQLANLLANGSGFWSLAPQAAVAVFDGGARRAAVRGQEAATDEAEAAYRETVLNALREVESSLTNWQEEKNRLADLGLAAQSSLRSYTLSQALYKEGEQSLLPVLEAQGSLVSAQDAQAIAHAQVVKNWVALIKALGGGYDRAVLK